MISLRLHFCERDNMLDILFFCGQVLSLAVLASGCYLTVRYGREDTLRESVAAVRFAEFNHTKRTPIPA